MLNGSNFKRTFVARNCTRTVGVTAANLTDTLAYGEMVILNEKGAIIATNADAVAAKGMIVVQGTHDAAPLFSQIFWKKDIKDYKASKFLQIGLQKYALGYNGAAGSIEVIGANVYGLTVEFRLNNSRGNGDPYITRASYEAKASGETQFGIANEIAKLLSLNFQQFDQASPKVTVTTDSAGAAGLTGCEVVRGSKVMSYTGGTPLLGSVYIVPGLAGTIYGTELTGVYKTVYIDTVNKVVELDKVYNGSSQTALACNIIADVSVDDYGLIVETNTYTQASGYEAFLSAEIIATPSEFGVTTVTDSGTGFSREFGYGRHEQVKNSQLFHQSYWGRNARQSVEYQNKSNVVDDNTGYSSVMFVSESSDKINTLETNGQSVPVQIYLQRGTYVDIKANAAGTTFGTNILTGIGTNAVDANSILNVLNAFMVSAGVVTAGVNTVINGGGEVTAATTYNTGIDV